MALLSDDSGSLDICPVIGIPQGMATGARVHARLGREDKAHWVDRW
jgi:hypothetical protein